MRRFMAIWQREAASHFFAPALYVALVLYLLLAGLTFLWALDRNAGVGSPFPALLITAAALWMPILVTVITMNLFAEEKRTGTLEPLLAAPVEDWEVVLGKYAGALTFCLAALLPTLSYAWLIPWVAPSTPPIDTVTVMAAGGMLTLVTAFCTALGLLASLLTRKAVVAALVAFVAICSPFAIRPLAAGLPPELRGLPHALAAENHLLDAAHGIVDSQPLVLYVTATWLLLFLSVRILESRRWT
jgi:ABC-2 type transport system permease protein